MQDVRRLFSIIVEGTGATMDTVFKVAAEVWVLAVDEFHSSKEVSTRKDVAIEYHILGVHGDLTSKRR